MSRLDQVLECRENIDALEEKLKILREQQAGLMTEQRKFRDTINKVSDEEFLNDGITNGKSAMYLSLANTRIYIRPNDINWDKIPCEKTYRVEGYQRHENAMLTEAEIRRRLDVGELRQPNEKDKPLATVIRFKEIRNHRDDIYIGITARGKITVFESNYHFRIEPEKQYYLVYDKKHDRYEARHMTGPTYRKKTSSYNDSTVKVLAHFTNPQDLVAYLL